MNTFNDREQKVMNFMETVQEQRLMKEQEDAFLNSTDYKLKALDKCEKDAKNICLDDIFLRLYKDAVPLNDEYKSAYQDELDSSFHDFMATRCPKGMEYYVKEGLRKNSPFAKRVLEAVEDLVNNEYETKAKNIEDYKPDELVFDNNEDVQKKLDIVGQNLAIPEISQAIKDNVKQTALSEITRAKKEKEAIKSLESELANDVNVTNAEAVESAMELHGYGETKDYIPSLFTAVMINKMNKLQPSYESGENNSVYLYGALDDYGKESEKTEEGVSFAGPDDLAFIEAVKEYTALSMLKALKFESFNKYDVADMAQDYAQARF